jgi:hypothetical protein
MKTANSIVAGFAGALLLALGTTVNAEEQLVLSDADMDGVTAGWWINSWSDASGYASFTGFAGGGSSFAATASTPTSTAGVAGAEAAGMLGTASANSWTDSSWNTGTYWWWY